MPSFDAFLRALTQQESGGNYRAVGVWVRGDRAYGRYQIMGANIPSWTAQYYGRRLTPQQFLHNNKAQDAVVRGKLGGYVKKYGYRGAASAWYSGNPNLHMSTRSQYGGPSIKGYVDSIMRRAASYGGSSGGSGGGGGGSWSPRAVKAKLNSRELAERYGLTSALVNSSGELKSLFKKAVAGQWSAERFQASLRNTRWWKKQPSSLRKYVTQKHSDPATYKQKRKHAAYEVNQMAIEMGMGNQMKGGKWTHALSEAVYNKVAWGWTDARLKDWLGRRAVTHDGQMWGEAGEVFNKLHEMAYMNGVEYSKTWYAKRVRDVIGGRSTLQTQESKIRAEAAAKYVNFRDQIKAGQNAIALAAPYIKSVSQILELPESDVDLFDKHVHSAMSGGKAGQNFPLWEFERMVRRDERWKATNNAREGIMGVAHQVARDFGFAS